MNAVCDFIKEVKPRENCRLQRITSVNFWIAVHNAFQNLTQPLSRYSTVYRKMVQYTGKIVGDIIQGGHIFEKLNSLSFL